MPNILSSPLQLQQPQPYKEPEDDLRSFDDVKTMRQRIYNNVLSAAQTMPDAANQRHTLRLTDVSYVDPEAYPIKAQKEAILSGRTLGRRMRGTWQLIDNATEQIIAHKKATVARVPYVTDRGTIIHGGNEYTISNQLRLRPGIFARIKENGMAESHLNCLSGKGISHRYFLDPEKGTFQVQIAQAKIPLMPLLKTLGAKDEQIREAWGTELWNTNAQLNDASAITKLYMRLAKRKHGEQEDVDKEQAIRDAFARMELDPDVTESTLGKRFKHVDAETILAATKKLLAVSRGEQDPDDRDHLAYQTVFGPEDLFAERLQKDYGGARKNLLRRASFKGSLDVIQPGALTRQLESVLLNSGLAQSAEEINPGEILDKLSRVSRMGEGAMSSLDAIPEESRSVQPSHFGYVDPIRTPESARVGVDTYLSGATRKGSDGHLYTKFINAKTGRPVWRSPQQLKNATIAFPGELEKRTSKRVGAMSGGKIKFVPREQVNYVLPHFEEAFSPLGNLIPLKSAVKGQRMAMASRMSLAGDSIVLITRSDGSTYRGRIDEYEWQPGDSALSVDKRTKQVCWRTVRRLVKHRNELLLYRVELKSGRTVTATADHSFVTLDESGDLTKLHTQDLAVGTPIPVVGSFEPKEIATSIWEIPAGEKHNAHPGATWSLDFALGWIHGIYLSEGNVCKRKDGTARAVQLANLDEGVLRKILAFFSKKNVYACSRSGRSDGQDDRVIVNWKQLAIKLRADFGDGSYNKRIADWVFSAPAVYRRGLIAGYLAGDGTVTKQRKVVRVTGSTRSRTLRDGLVDVLATLGICTSIREHRVSTGPKGSDAVQYMFSVWTEHVSRLPKLQHSGKDAIVLQYPWSQTRSQDWVPIALDWHKQIVAHSRRGDHNRYKLYTGQHTRSSLAALLSGSGSNAEAWLKSGVVWDRVVGLTCLPTDVCRYVYDLDMDDNVFVCNSGIVVHNTTQALPLEAPEAPFVQTGIPGEQDRSYEEQYGSQMGAVFSDKPGTVLSVNADGIKVRYDDGTTETKELYNTFPFNRKTFFNNIPLVQPGQRINAGSILAKSNYTDDTGTTALGKNFRVAYIPFRGLNFEDALVISESAAKKLTSEHMYQHGVEWSDQHKPGKRNFVSLFPGKYDKEALAKLDDDGIVLPGTVVNADDPLILAARQREQLYGKVHKKRAAAYNDQTEVWEHHSPGVVTDVFKTPKGTAVLVKSLAEMQEGDKLCFDPATALLTRKGWKPVAEVGPTDEIATLNPETDELEWQCPTHVWHYWHDGPMYYLNTKQLNMLVTLEHRLWVSRDGIEYSAMTAGDFYKAKGEWFFKKDCRWSGIARAVMDFGDPVREYREKTQVLRHVSMDDWLEFLGYYIAEGCCVGSYVRVSQFRKSKHWQKIDDVLKRLNLTYRYNEADSRFELGNVWLAELLAPLGNSLTKYVPEYVQELCPRQLRIFFDAYMAGDGHQGESWKYGSSSQQLAEDIALICMKLGWTTRIRKSIRTDNWQRNPHWCVGINRTWLRPRWSRNHVKQCASNKEELVDYSGEVFCVTVPNHIVYCRREDKSYWSLNSGRYG